MTVLTNLKIWDGLGDGVRSDVDAVEIAGGKIINVGTTLDLASGQSRDMGGLFVTPGLIDAHIHLCLNPDIMKPEDQDKFTRDELLSQMKERAIEMARAGITTARDLGGGQWLELEVRDAIRRGETRGPRLICSGQPVTSVKGHCHFWGGEANSETEALEVVERQVLHNVDLIKVMATGGNLTKGSTPKDSQFDLETLRAIVASAAEHGFHVAAHCHGTNGIGLASEAGVRTIEHCSWVGESGWAKDFDEVICESLVEHKAFVSPTINLGWKRRIGSGEYEALLQDNYAKMKSKGIRLIASTDAGIPKVYHHDLPKALPVFAHFAGLTNVEVLKSATSVCAEAIGIANVTGRIEAGLSADLAFFEANPIDDLAALESPFEVLCEGEPQLQQLESTR